jgi:hypothetical protein
MKPPFRFVGVQPSHDTINILDEMLKAARRGDVIGVAFAAMYKRREYVVGYTGECARNPTFARGMVIALLEDLGHANTIRR